MKNLESWVLESGIQLKESGNPSNDWNPESKFTDRDWNPVTRNLNPRLSWIPLHGAMW